MRHPRRNNIPQLLHPGEPPRPPRKPSRRAHELGLLKTWRLDLEMAATIDLWIEQRQSGRQVASDLSPELCLLC